jgi:serine O-acetyltransferase
MTIDHASAETAPGTAARGALTLRQLLALLREDYRVHHRDSSLPGFRALTAYRLGSWRHSHPNRLVRYGLALPSRALLRFVRNYYGIELYSTARIGRRVAIAHQGGIVIHERAEIGHGVIIRQGCTVGAISDDRFEAPVLEDEVELGVGSVIVGPVRIGRAARIGPNAVVMRDVPPRAIVFAPQSRVIESAPAEE